MTSKEIFVRNLRVFRRKEGLSQMKLAELCNTAPSYIGQIETGRKFPSMEMIDKIAEILRIEVYQLFRNNEKKSANTDVEIVYPLLPNSMKELIKEQIKTMIDNSANEILNEVLGKY